MEWNRPPRPSNPLPSSAESEPNRRALEPSPRITALSYCLSASWTSDVRRRLRSGPSSSMGSPCSSGGGTRQAGKRAGSQATSTKPDCIDQRRNKGGRGGRKQRKQPPSQRVKSTVGTGSNMKNNNRLNTNPTSRSGACGYILSFSCPRAHLPSGSPPSSPPPSPQKHHRWVGGRGWWYQIHVSSRQHPPPSTTSPHPHQHLKKPQRFGSPSGSALPDNKVGDTRSHWKEGATVPVVSSNTPHQQHHSRPSDALLLTRVAVSQRAT